MCSLTHCDPKIILVLCFSSYEINEGPILSKYLCSGFCLFKGMNIVVFCAYFHELYLNISAVSFSRNNGKVLINWSCHSSF